LVALAQEVVRVVVGSLLGEAVVAEEVDDVMGTTVILHKVRRGIRKTLAVKDETNG
jgi:hypothetical protein